MSFGELFTWVSIAVIGVWAFYIIRRSIRGDHDWSSQLHDFARDKALSSHKVDRGPGVYELNTKITSKLVKSWWSRNPSMKKPPMGSIIFKGKSNGLSIFIDTVLIRKHWNNLYDEYLRIAVELPELPRSLTIHPTGRIRRFARLIGFKQAYRGDSHPGNLTVIFSSNPSERRTEQSFLSMNRLRILEEFEKKLSGVYVYDGKVFLINRKQGANQLSLDALYDNIILLATKLFGAG